MTTHPQWGRSHFRFSLRSDPRALSDIYLKRQRRVVVWDCIPQPIRAHDEEHVLLVEPRRIWAGVEPIAAIGILPASVVVAPTVLLKASVMIAAEMAFVIFVAILIFLTIPRVLALGILRLGLGWLLVLLIFLRSTWQSWVWWFNIIFSWVIVPYIFGIEGWIYINFIIFSSNG